MPNDCNYDDNDGLMTNTTTITHLNSKIFAAELIGTFVLVALATGTIVYDSQTDQQYGVWFAAAGPFVALILGVYLFGSISLAHFNPAVTMAFYITGHITRIQAVWYFTAQLAGSLLGSLFVAVVVGNGADLGANVPNYDYHVLVIVLVEVLASFLLMAVILAVVYTKGLRGLSGIAIGGIVALDIIFFGSISGASMNPIRSLAPALFSDALDHMWLYWSAPYVGTAMAAFLFRQKLWAHQRKT